MYFDYCEIFQVFEIGVRYFESDLVLTDSLIRNNTLYRRLWGDIELTSLAITKMLR